ncbi:MAG: cobalamin B12-binding domain-containing protein [Deltaproteobacteria bacterium]|nr:cobalamin B12-binding domain-containing protein [Deltaproteobacteria bacterium]
MSAVKRDDRLAALLRDLDENGALKLASERLQAGEDAVAIMEACQEGMVEVGTRYEQGQYYLSGLIMAGEILRRITELLKPALEGRSLPGRAGSVLLGTVRGDIHDIGKNMVGMLLRCNGFAVEDVGVDVPPEEFVLRAAASKPEIIGLSGILTISYDAMRATVAALRESSDPEVARTPVIIGGGLVDEQVAHYVGADYWASDAMGGLRRIQAVHEGRAQ